MTGRAASLGGFGVGLDLVQNSPTHLLLPINSSHLNSPLVTVRLLNGTNFQVFLWSLNFVHINQIFSPLLSFRALPAIRYFSFKSGEDDWKIIFFCPIFVHNFADCGLATKPFRKAELEYATPQTLATPQNRRERNTLLAYWIRTHSMVANQTTHKAKIQISLF